MHVHKKQRSHEVGATFFFPFFFPVLGSVFTYLMAVDMLLSLSRWNNSSSSSSSRVVVVVVIAVWTIHAMHFTLFQNIPFRKEKMKKVETKDRVAFYQC